MNENISVAYQGKRVVVTGGAGAIGSNLCRALLSSGAKRVTVLDDLSSAQRWNLPDDDRLHFIQGSVLEDDDLAAAFRDQPDITYHLAALFANQNSIEHPERDLMVNGLGTLKTLRRAHSAGVERFVYASSGCSVYGKSPLPLREDFLSMDLDTPYQITKMLGELYGNFFHHFYGLKVVRTRFFNSYGPGEVPGRYRNVIPNFICWAMQGRPLPITGTGDETRDWTYVEDIVNGLLRAGCVDAAVGDAFNLASGTETKVSDVARWINEETGNTAGVEYIDRRKWDSKTRLLASVEKAGATLGYRPVTDFRTGLKRTVDWFRSDWDRIRATAAF